jgi:hypothetical protein
VKKLRNYSAAIFAACAILFSINAIKVNAQGGFLNKITDRIDRKKPDGNGRTVDDRQSETKNDSVSNVFVPSVAPMTVDVPSIQIYTGRSDTSSQTSWKWIPRIDFKINGRLPSGSRLAVEYTLPGNKPWLTIDCEPESKFDGKILVVQNCGRTTTPEKSSLATGIVNFKILLTNELAGKNQILFAGRFKVEKFLNNPQFRNEVDFYVDQDWNLPVGYIYAAETRNYLSPESAKSVDFGALEAAMWFRGAEKTRQIAGYLFYNGKQIAHTENTGQGTAGAEFEVNTFNSNTNNEWARVKFVFFNVHLFNYEPLNQHPDAFHVQKNPGEYEIKVLRNGKLARSLKFKVGADGRIVPPGGGGNYDLNTYRFVFPVEILGDADGAWNREAWKTEAFYGHPPAGFVAP